MPDLGESSRCRGCGKAIVWGLTPEGKKIPLDPAPPVYEVVGIHTQATGVAVRRAPKWAGGMPANGPGEPATFGFAVSHFATCPKANEFSGSRKPERTV